MKKIVVILLALIFMVSVAAAEEIDLSALSFDELVALKDKINLAIWSSQEWQEVTVPQGLYIVGQDIPVGTWTVKSIDSQMNNVRLSWGYQLAENGKDIVFEPFKTDIAAIYSKSNIFYEEGQLLEYTFEAKEGMYVRIEYTSAIFSPYVGKPDLGFR